MGNAAGGEEVLPSTLKDPTQPNAAGGHIYEIDPQTGTAVVREAFGSRPHEGMRFDKDGNLMASRRPARATSTSLCRLSAMT